VLLQAWLDGAAGAAWRSGPARAPGADDHVPPRAQG